jgi:protein-S-isoprenylcysteine O-methyltransferase Ste14
MYSVVRNPIYIGNFIIWVGIVLLARAALLAAVCVLAFFIYYERIIVTEAAAS